MTFILKKGAIHPNVICCLLLSVLALVTKGQTITADSINNVSTVYDSRYLLNDLQIQLETTDAINDMYNFDFHDARVQFIFLNRQYPTHPLPQFLLGLSYWWEIVAAPSSEAYDDPMIDHLNEAIDRGKDYLDKEGEENNGEIKFLLSAAYALKGRLYGDRSSYTKAAFAGQKAIKYLEECHDLGQFSPELWFGDGLYNYYSIWIPENYPLLKPLLSFFRKGSKSQGLKELKKASAYAFYTRIEAQYFLMKILDSEEGRHKKALIYAKRLHKNFPNNPYFHRYLARILYNSGRYIEAKAICLDIIKHLDNQQHGYEGNSGRYAGFFLGQIYTYLRQPKEAEKYYKKAVDYARQVDTMSAGYCLYSMIALGDFALARGDKKRAKYYYKTTKKEASRSHKSYDIAKAALKKL